MALNLTPSDRERLSVQLNDVINAALETWNARQKPRTYLGGSRLGVECLRALGFEWHSQREAARVRDEIAARGLTPSIPLTKFPGKVIRRFQMGHIHEAETANWLRLAGFELLTHGTDGEQFGFQVAADEAGNPRMAGHLDGVITAGPVDLPYPLLWEHKIMNAKKWREFMRDGLEKSNPVYWGQVHVYMGYMELGAALFTSLNTDTSELGFELVVFDLPTAQRMSDRGVRVIESARPEDLPRITEDRSDYRCKWCAHKARCWELKPISTTYEAGPKPGDKPAWLMGGA